MLALQDVSRSQDTLLRRRSIPILCHDGIGARARSSICWLFFQRETETFQQCLLYNDFTRQSKKRMGPIPRRFQRVFFSVLIDRANFCEQAISCPKRRDERALLNDRFLI